MSDFTTQKDTSLEPELAMRDAVAQSRALFNAAANDLRPRLHRFCTRMCGSPLDGEDVVQETLAEAFYNFSTLREGSRLEAWLFRIAYHKCIDLARRERRHHADVSIEESEALLPLADVGDGEDAPTDEALATLIGELPPKERAAVILKDVLDYSLSEIATIADSTLGGVKAALHRGRAKLRDTSDVRGVAELDAAQRSLFEAYAECFNRRDWVALKRLVRADARLEIVGEALGTMGGLGATYSGNYTRLSWEWRLSAAVVGGRHVILHSKWNGATWEPYSAVVLRWENGEVAEIRDYIHVAYLFADQS